MNDDIARLTADLRAEEPSTRAQAAEGLCRLGEEAQAAAVDLVQACGDTVEDVREWAAAALEELGPPPTDSVKDLAVLVGHSSPGVSYWAATLLGRLEGAAAPAAPVLAEALRRHPDLATRERAAWALGKIGERSPVVLEALRTAAGESGAARLARLAAAAIEKIEQQD